MSTGPKTPEGRERIAEALRNSAPAMANRALPGAVDYPQIPALAERGLGAVAQSYKVLSLIHISEPTRPY